MVALEHGALGGFATGTLDALLHARGAWGELGVLSWPSLEVAQDDFQPLYLVLLERVELVPVEQAALALLDEVRVVADVDVDLAVFELEIRLTTRSSR